MNRLILDKNDIGRGNLILVNRQYPLRTEPNAGHLTAIYGSEAKILSQAAKLFSLLMAELGCADTIVPISAWRSRIEQQELYDQCLSNQGAIFTEKYVAYPGCSEHQSGLALDLAENRPQIDFLCPEFPDSGICGEFRRLAPSYGFIQRYRENKKNITGIAAEPWHFRYLGWPHSQLIEQDQLCLEEYISLLHKHRYQEQHRQIGCNGKSFEIFYVSAQNEPISVCIPEAFLCTVSGDNISGFIVTLWKKS